MKKRATSSVMAAAVMGAGVVALLALSAYEMKAVWTSCPPTMPSRTQLIDVLKVLVMGPFSRMWQDEVTRVHMECTHTVAVRSPLPTFGATAATYWLLTLPLHLVNAFVVFNVALSVWGALAGILTIVNASYLHDAMPFFSFKPVGIAPKERKQISNLGWKLINVPMSFYMPLWILVTLHWMLWVPTIVSNLVLCRFRRFTHRFRKGPVVYRRGMKKPTLDKPNMDGKPEWDVEWVDRLLEATPEMMTEMVEFVRGYEKGEFGPSDHYELVNFVPKFGSNLSDHATWNEELEKRCQGLKKTIDATAALAGEDNILVAKIVRLEPKKGGSGVQLHVDIYPNVVNVLIPIRAPKMQSFFYINGGGVIPFETGEPIIFNPSFLHAAWNDSEESTRYVYNIAVSTGSCGAIKRWCAYNFTKKVGSYKIRYYSD